MFDVEQRRSAPFVDHIDRALRRTIDIAFATILLVLASPLIAVLALAIRAR